MCENLAIPGSTFGSGVRKVLPGMSRFSHMVVWLRQNHQARGARGGGERVEGATGR